MHFQLPSLLLAAAALGCAVTTALPPGWNPYPEEYAFSQPGQYILPEKYMKGWATRQEFEAYRQWKMELLHRLRAEEIMPGLSEARRYDLFQWTGNTEWEIKNLDRMLQEGRYSR